MGGAWGFDNTVPPWLLVGAQSTKRFFWTSLLDYRVNVTLALLALVKGNGRQSRWFMITGNNPDGFYEARNPKAAH
jgi:hypothetical protein